MSAIGAFQPQKKIGSDKIHTGAAGGTAINDVLAKLKLVGTKAGRLGRACLRPVRSNGRRALALAQLPFRAASSQGRACVARVFKPGTTGSYDVTTGVEPEFRKSLAAQMLDCVTTRARSVSDAWSHYQSYVEDDSPLGAFLGTADFALRQLKNDTEQALWNFSVNQFEVVLENLEASTDRPRSVKNALHLAALEVWCEVYPLPTSQKGAGGAEAPNGTEVSRRVGRWVKRHELRSALKASFGETLDPLPAAAKVSPEEKLDELPVAGQAAPEKKLNQSSVVRQEPSKERPDESQAGPKDLPREKRPARFVRRPATSVAPMTLYGYRRIPVHDVLKG